MKIFVYDTEAMLGTYNLDVIPAVGDLLVLNPYSEVVYEVLGRAFVASTDNSRYAPSLTVKKCVKQPKIDRR